MSTKWAVRYAEELYPFKIQIIIAMLTIHSSAVTCILHVCCIWCCCNFKSLSFCVNPVSEYSVGTVWSSSNRVDLQTRRYRIQKIQSSFALTGCWYFTFLEGVKLIPLVKRAARSAHGSCQATACLNCSLQWKHLFVVWQPHDEKTRSLHTFRDYSSLIKWLWLWNSIWECTTVFCVSDFSHLFNQVNMSLNVGHRSA